MTLNTFHALLTRFNIRYGSVADPRVLSPEWLGTRMQLFRQFTVPSVASQSRLPDGWLVFFDEGTPDSTREEFRLLSARLPFLRAVYCSEFAPKLAVERACRIMAPRADWLLTTRLDNDDALNRRFIETVQSQARPGVREFINPACGLILADRRLYRYRDYSSPFITFSEPLADCLTVLIDQHPLLARHGPVRQFSLPDAWVQVVHGGNLVNGVRGVLISPTKVLPDAFPPDLGVSLVNVGFRERLLCNCFSPFRYLASRAWRRGRRMWAGAADKRPVKRHRTGRQHESAALSEPPPAGAPNV